MNRPRIYIAGPISRGNLAANVHQATQAALDLIAAGFAPFCPHWSVYAGGPLIGKLGRGIAYAVAESLPAGTTHPQWMEVALPWVDVADAILRLPGESIGADMETARGREQGLPVFKSVEDVIRWGAFGRVSESFHKASPADASV